MGDKVGDHGTLAEDKQDGGNRGHGTVGQGEDSSLRKVSEEEDARCHRNAEDGGWADFGDYQAP